MENNSNAVTPGDRPIMTIQPLNNSQLLASAAMMIAKLDKEISDLWDEFNEERRTRMNAEAREYHYMDETKRLSAQLEAYSKSDTDRLRQISELEKELVSWKEAAKKWELMASNENKALRDGLAESQQIVNRQQVMLKESAEISDNLWRFLNFKIPGVYSAPTDTIATMAERAFDTLISQRDALLNAAINVRENVAGDHSHWLGELNKIIDKVAANNPCPGYVTKEIEDRLREADELRSRAKIVEADAYDIQNEREEMQTHLENLKARHEKEIKDLRQLAGLDENSIPPTEIEFK